MLSVKIPQPSLWKGARSIFSFEKKGIEGDFRPSIRVACGGFGGIPHHFFPRLLFLTSIIGLIGFSSHAAPGILVVGVHPAATAHQAGDVESTTVVPPWKWHSKLALDSVFVSGTEKRLVQTRFTMGLGFGLPHGLELHLSLPVGYTFHHFAGNGETGGGPGDLRAGLLYQLKGASKGGLGL
ncbi:MAG: hypothetical protein JXX14_11480, partial [Deltaproteobacteria bacterium]|nr:hypothetical protein [Deltaproteobacteria bacterium]